MESNKDAPKVLSFTDDGKTVTMERQGDHGFIFLSINKGKLPEKYTGAYTSFEVAKQAVDHLFEENKLKKVS